MKWWNQAAACVLVLSVSLQLPVYGQSPEFARTPEEWERLRDNVLEYDELAGLIREYNVTVRNNQATYNDERGKSRQDLSEDYWDAASDLYDLASGLDYETAASQIWNLQIQAKSMEKQAASNTQDSEMKKLGYDRTEATYVSTAQAYMNQYHVSVLELQAKWTEREMLSLEYDTMKVKNQTGMASAAELLAAQESLSAAAAQIEVLQNKIQNTKQKLCLMTGWRYDDTPDIRPIPAPDVSRIAAMNPEMDKTKAIDQNYTLRLTKKERENTSVGTDKQKLDKKIQDQEQQIAASVKNLYNEVLQARSACGQLEKEMDLEKKNMVIAEQKYNTGSISRLEYLKQRAALQTKETGRQTADMALTQAMDNYDWAINGLAGTGES